MYKFLVGYADEFSRTWRIVWLIGAIVVIKFFIDFVGIHWEKYMQLTRNKYNREHPVQLQPIVPHICRNT